MKKIFIVFTLSLILTSLFAQQDTLPQPSSKPVRFTFGTTTLVDNNTTETIYKGGLEFQIASQIQSD